MRTMVGIGAFGFNAGVYMGLRFPALRSKHPTSVFRAGRERLTFIDSGVGYSIPDWVTDAINRLPVTIYKSKVDPLELSCEVLH